MPERIQSVGGVLALLVFILAVVLYIVGRTSPEATLGLLALLALAVVL